jgi:hypothetical protein
VIVLVLPEPASWAAPLRASLGAVTLFSPPFVHVAGRAIGKLWARSRTDRRMLVRFARRAVVDRLAALWLPRDARVVVAPSCGAERVFAVAKQRGCETVLVHDLPCLRELHEDLDTASRRYRDSKFLRRYRAPRRTVVRQETERVLADRVLVNGACAENILAARGIAKERMQRLVETTPSLAPRARRTVAAPALLLAGLAAARNGTHEALSAIDGRPDLTLLVRPGEGTEPLGLSSHPRVRAASKRVLETLEGIDGVLAPAWCESYPREVRLALAAGIPVIGTRCAVGDHPGARVIERGDERALRLAIDALWPHPGQAVASQRALDVRPDV